MGYSIGILNNIRANASAEYQNRIPEATQQNIASIGNALQTYTLLYNEFASALMNKIGKTLLEQKLFKNRLSRFKSGTVLNQQDVEEIFIEMAKAEGSYDKNGKNPLGRRNPPDIKAIYHRMNRQDYYCISIGDIDFVRVFRSEATLDSFISGLINSVYSGAEYDEWQAMKNLLATYDGYATVAVPRWASRREGANPDVPGDNDLVVNTDDYCAKTFVKQLRKVVMDMTFASKNFNKAGVMTWSKPENLVLLVNKDVLTEVDVEVLSKAYNMGKTNIQIDVIPMDDFGTLTDTYGIIIDKDWFRVFDTLSHMEPQRNAQGLFTNYFYHIHQILSASTFKQAVRFVAQPAV